MVVDRSYPFWNSKSSKSPFPWLNRIRFFFVLLFNKSIKSPYWIETNGLESVFEERINMGVQINLMHMKQYLYLVTYSHAHLKIIITHFVCFRLAEFSFILIWIISENFQKKKVQFKLKKIKFESRTLNARIAF